MNHGHDPHRPVFPTALPRGPLAAMGWVSLAGLALSVELTRIHYLIHTDPTYHALCDAGGRISCGAVALSPYSVLWGVPVSSWGALAYLLFLVLTLWGLSSRKPHDTWPSGLLLCFSGSTCLMSLRLAYLSFAKIDAICIYCNGLHLVNAALLFLSAALIEKRGLHPARAVLADLIAWRRPGWCISMFTVFGLAAVVGLFWGWPKYWESPDWKGLGGLSTGTTKRGEHWIGAASPKVVIVEFTDYECPYCRLAHRNVRHILSRYGDRIRLVHRHFPLDHQCNMTLKRPFHRNACRFSAFAACAGIQGRFWDANDALYSMLDRERPENIRLEPMVVRLGMDVSRWRDCMEGGPVMERIRDDIEEGVRLGVTGTPTYFINGRRWEGVLTPKKLEDLLKTDDP